jgi:protein gp37
MPSGRDWWWDVTWNPVGGCLYVSPGCANCFAPEWVKSHTHDVVTAHTGIIDIREKRVVRDGKVKVLKQAVFNGKLTTLRDTHHC